VLASSTVYRGYHSVALLLPDGRVLSAGGNVGLNTAEIYSPSYLFRGPRPTIASAPTSVTYNETFFVGTPDAANISKVTWVRLASVTHAFDQNQRINHLSFSQAAGGLNVTTPASASLCPPGHYLLFILNSSGVPSVATIIRIEAGSGSPAAPSSLTATAISDTQIDLGWTDNASNEDGFRVERSLDGTTFQQIAALGADSTNYSDAGLSPGTAYYYRVIAYNGVGSSAYSNTANATTSAPAPAVTLSPNSLNFGKQPVGTTSAPKTVTLTNSGTAYLSVSQITASGDFKQTNNCVGIAIAPGESCTINVTFTPTAKGARKGEVAITDNAAGSPHKISLTGTGVRKK